MCVFVNMFTFFENVSGPELSCISIPDNLLQATVYSMQGEVFSRWGNKLVNMFINISLFS